MEQASAESCERLNADLGGRGANWQAESLAILLAKGIFARE